MPASTASGASVSSRKSNSSVLSFTVNEKVLVLWNERIFDAKVLKVDKAAHKYFLHYHGWKATWDEWRNADEVMKDTEENRKKQQQINSTAVASTPSNKKKGKIGSDKKKSQAGHSQQQQQPPTSEDGDSRPGTPDSVLSNVSSTGSSTRPPVAKRARPTAATDAADHPKDESSQETVEPLSATRKRRRGNSPASAAVGKGGGASVPPPSSTDTDDTQSETTHDQPSSTPPQAAAAAAHTEKPEAKTERKQPATEGVDKEDTPAAPPQPTAATAPPSGESLLSSEHGVQITLPKRLQERLVDDQDMVVRQKLLVSLPAALTVGQVVNMYIEQCHPAKDMCAIQVAYGMKDLFNVVLGTSLLYKFERPQYERILDEQKSKSSPNTPMCDIYGVEHLLRFFLKVIDLLKDASLAPDHLEFVVPHIASMVMFLQEKADTLFSESHYEQSTQEYIRSVLNE